MAAPRALSSTLIPRQLSDLKISSGTSVQLEHYRTRKRTRAEWIGFAEPERLLIRSSSLKSFARPGERLRVRLISGNWICAFDSELAEAIEQPLSLWFLSYPKQLEVARLRDETRLPLVLKVRVDGEDPLSGPEGVSGLVTDLHHQGAQLQSRTDLGRVGDTLFLSTLIQFAGAEQLLLVPAKVSSKQQESVGTGTSFLFGLKFEDLDEETRVYLHGFIAEQYLATQGFEFGAGSR